MTPYFYTLYISFKLWLVTNVTNNANMYFLTNSVIMARFNAQETRCQKINDIFFYLNLLKK